MRPLTSMQARVNCLHKSHPLRAHLPLRPLLRMLGWPCWKRYTARATSGKPGPEWRAKQYLLQAAHASASLSSYLCICIALQGGVCAFLHWGQERVAAVCTGSDRRHLCFGQGGLEGSSSSESTKSTLLCVFSHSLFFLWLQLTYGMHAHVRAHALKSRSLHTHTHTHTHAHTRTHTHIHTHKNTHTRTHTHTDVNEGLWIRRFLALWCKQYKTQTSTDSSAAITWKRIALTLALAYCQNESTLTWIEGLARTI